MAFLPDQQDPTQQGQQQNQIPAVPQIPTLQGTSGPNAGQGAGTTNTAAGSPGAAPSSPWANITSYLQANSGQAGQVADKIAGNLQTQYNTANQGIQQAGQNFGQQIESARVPVNQDLVSRAAASPSSVVQDPNNVAAFQRMLNATYQGPKDFSTSQGYSDLQSKIQGAQKNAALVNQGTAGLQTLLQPIESQGGKNPSAGITALDTILMQEDPANFAKLSAAAQPFSGLTDYLSKTQAGLDTAAQNAAKEAAATQQQVQNQFLGPNGVSQTFGNTLANQAQQANTARQAYNDAFTQNQTAAQQAQQQLQNALTADQQRIRLGVVNTGNSASDAAQQAKVLDYINSQPYLDKLAPFINGQPVLTPPTLANTATAQQYADDAALAQLLGGAYSPFLDQSQIGQAGSFKTPTDLGPVPDLSGQLQYINDITNEFTTPQANFTQTNWRNLDPQQIAQSLLSLAGTSGSGVNPTPDDLASLQRLVANSYAGR